MTQHEQLTVHQAISRARKAIKQGNSAEALQLYNAVLRHQPSHPIAKKELRKLHKGISQNQSIPVESLDPPQDQITVLVDLYHSEQMRKTEQSSKKLLQTYPQSLTVMNILSEALKAQGKLQSALQVFDEAIQLKPDFAEIYSKRGNILKVLARLDEAVFSYDKAIQLKPGYAEAHNNRGNALQELGRMDEAVESYDQAIQLKPDYAEAYNNRGNAIGELGQLNGAVENYDIAIQLRPDFAEAYNNRGNALRKLRRMDEAVENYDQAIQLRPYLAEAYNSRGAVLSDLGLLEEAVADYDVAIELKPDYAEAYNNLGNALKDLGKFREAIGSHKKAIQLKPNYAKGHRDLSFLKKYTPDDPQIPAMESLVIDTDLGESDHMHLYFALGKAYGDIGGYNKSFNYLEKGNNLRGKALDYNIDEDIKLFAKIKKVFHTKNLVSEVVPGDDTSTQSIFIIGMPRSGTSLVEQILASHTKVHGAGELEAMGELMFPIILGPPDQGTRQDEAKLSTNDISAVRNGYLEALTALKVSEGIITDKMPLNFRWIGFILSAFPHTKIIHLNRDPRATCWSIYKNYFTGIGNGYAYDMDNLAKFYKLYTGLMSFWRELFPTGIYDICYEDLTVNQEEETRGLLEFCGLEWEEKCLDFHKTKRVVATASAAQVREEMYTGSSEAWRKYENHLQPLIKALLL